MYNNQQNNQKQSDVSTRSYKTTNPNATIPTALSWDFQGEMLKLTFANELPKEEQTETRRYDYTKPWTTLLTRLKCMALVDKIKETFPDKIAKKEPYFIAVAVADVNLVGVGIDVKDDNVYTYIDLIKGINPETLTTEDHVRYEFKKNELIYNYNPSSGKFDKKEMVASEFVLFVTDMMNFINATSKAYNHANRVVDKSYKDMIISDLRSIGKKVGAEVSMPYGSSDRNGAQYGGASLFDNNGSKAINEPIQSVNDLDVNFDDELPFN